MQAPLDALAQDRILGPMVRNASLSQALYGLMDGMLGVCSDHGWAPETIGFRDVTLSDGGFLRMRFNRGRGGYSPMSVYLGGDDFRSFIGSQARAPLNFLTRCKSFRRLMGTIYDRAIRFAHDGGVPFEDMEFGISRINDRTGTAWMRFYRKDADRLWDERKGR